MFWFVDEPPDLAKAILIFPPELKKCLAALADQKQRLKEQCEANLNFAFNGGLFKIVQTLISFVYSFVCQGKESMIILDANGTPVELEDLKSFHDTITSRWFESVNEYNRQYQELANKRKVSKLVE